MPSAIFRLKSGCLLRVRGIRFGGLRRVKFNAIFEENGRECFPEKYSKIARWGEVSL